MNIVQINSGLGNQLFQYAFSRALQQQQPDTLLDISQYQYRPVHNGYELERLFCIHARYASAAQRDQLADISKDTLSVIRRALFGQKKCSGQYVVEPMDNPVYNEQYLSLDNCYFKGYWQTEKYFKPIEELLRHELQFKLCLTAREDLQLREQLEHSESVAIHVRLGDYTKKRRIDDYCVCTQTYYNNAVNLLRQSVKNPIFYVFSDDVEQVKQTMIMPENVVYVEGHSGQDAWKDMYLMSRAKHNIIANSTFSWWGAWLNQHKGKKVVAPTIWFRHRQRRDIIAEGWSTVEV